MTVRHLIVGTAGHIDHGKSALVKSLTGTDPDRLKEEKARGITIELGFADLDLGDGRVVSMVDVPGHERFVRHMVSGATGIDALMLVIAADEGVKPQTREHLEICELLGIPRGLVALSKVDLVDPDLQEVVALEVRELLADTFLKDAPLIPVSSRTGQGIDRLRGELANLFAVVSERSAAGLARLPVDRSFVLKGFGTVVTGSLVSGSLREGAEVEILPGARKGRVRGLQVHHDRVARAVAGQRTAVNLQGLSCADVPRGSTVTEPAALRCTRRLWARLRLLPAAPERLRRGGPVQFHQGTCERRARLRVLRELADGDLHVEIFLGRPTVVVPQDRFILRRPAPVNTVGGGVVLDVSPPRGRARLADLETLERDELAEQIGLRLSREGARGKTIVDLAAELGMRPGDLEPRVAELEHEGRLFGAAGRLFGAPAWQEVLSGVLEELDRYHRAEPLRTGVAREELRARVCDLFPQDAWRVLLDQLRAAGDLRLEGELVSRAGHQVVLSGADLALAGKIETGFLDAGLDPPAIEEIMPAAEAGSGQRILDLLIADGRLVKLPDGRLFHGAALVSLVDKLRDYARTSRKIDVGAFKKLAGVTRKNAIPLLEYLDQRRLTRRVGNVREILLVTEGE